MTNYSISMIEFWFIPMDMVMIISTILTIIFSSIFILVIISDKTCHTLSMMLVANSCVSSLAFGCVLFSMSLFTFQNDMKKLSNEDNQCIIRAYFDYVLAGVFNYSFLIQSIHRYLIAVYPTNSFYETFRFVFTMICISWLFAFIYPIELILTKGIIYNADNQICQLPIIPSFSMIYTGLFIYSLPVSGIMLIYFRLVRYVQQMNERITSVNILLRAQRQLKMIRRIFILVNVLFGIGFPYLLFALMSWFTSIPKYHFRIAFLFIDVSMLVVIIVLFQTNDPLKASIMRKLKLNLNAAFTDSHPDASEPIIE